MTTRKERLSALKEALAQRVLVLDGAMGTAIQDRNLTAEDFGGAELEGCNENLVFTRPDVISEIHEAYLKAGCDIVETNTFGSTPLVMAEYGLQAITHQQNLKAAELARKAADKYSTPAQLRFVAGSMGPTTKSITVTGGVTFEELVENFFVQAKGLYEGGVDYFLLETSQDTRNIKAGLLAIEKVNSSVSEPLPVAVSCTIEPMGTMLAGQTAEAFAASLAHKDLLYIGLNCATGPEFMTDHIRSLAQMTSVPVACIPNAGLPDENGHYLETPQMIATVLKRFGDAGWINLIGGCCGTTEAHITALSKLAREIKPREPHPSKKSFLSGIDYLELTNDQRPVLVGERTNVIGSKKFKDLIINGKFEEASEVARGQVKQGAAIIDCCLANPDRNELEDMEKFLSYVIKKVKVPLMIDSTDEAVIARALTYCQGKAIINSVNMEDGEERFEKVVPLAREFGAALVVGCIDETGMAVTRQRKLEVAQRTFDILTTKYGVQPEDIYWDPLVFPCATGDQQYVGSAVETIEGLRLIKKHFPQTKTVLGISNVSFGLPAAGREVLNSVFLYHCVQAGLDLAIVNSEKLVRYPSIPEEEKKLSDDLLWNRGADPVAAFAAHFREKKPAGTQTNKKDLPLMERLPRYIIEGSKDGLIPDLDEALKTMKPLAIINGPLMKGMDEVGRLFNANQLIVAEVLQSAESMKAAVNHLEQFMDKVDSANRGKIVLATVKGDVHDIGKNLVEIILGNNGFTVINLGIKVPSDQLIAAVRQHNPDIIGLSGLLVKSAQQMVLTADDLSKSGIHLPILVGGAALSRNFTDKRIAKAYVGGTVAYAQDAMDGLDLAKSIVDPEKFEQLKNALQERRKALSDDDGKRVEVQVVREERSSQVEIQKDIPHVPDFERHVIRNTPLEHIWNFINPRMLYGKHLGAKGPALKLIEAGVRSEMLKDEAGKKALSLVEAVDEIKHELKQGTMRPKAVFRYFKATSRGNDLILFDGITGREIAKFRFPRQNKTDGLCLADYATPLERSGGEIVDNICLYVVTAGEGIREMAENHKVRGDYLKSHVLQAFALESAEGYAELLHSKIRSQWGSSDPIHMTMMDRFQARYRGKRYSFGYPACPRLEDQKILFDLLKPEEIGVNLTEGFMMDPEASVSAIVFHHPQAIYFSVGDQPVEMRGVAQAEEQA